MPKYRLLVMAEGSAKAAQAAADKDKFKLGTAGITTGASRIRRGVSLLTGRTRAEA